MAMIFVSGANRWPPLGACSNNEPTSTDVATVIKLALLRIGLSETNVHSVQVALSGGGCRSILWLTGQLHQRACQTGDTSDHTLFLIVRVGHDVGIQCDVGMVDVDLAESMIPEALQIGDERVAVEAAARKAAEERTSAAELQVRQLENLLQIVQAQLNRAEERGAERALGLHTFFSYLE